MSHERAFERLLEWFEWEPFKVRDMDDDQISELALLFGYSPDDEPRRHVGETLHHSHQSHHRIRPSLRVRFLVVKWSTRCKTGVYQFEQVEQP